jgi:glycogen operon protein
MKHEEWNSGWVRCIGLFLNGRTLADVNAVGDEIVDDSFFLLLNPSNEEISFTLPAPRKGYAWEAVLDTRHPVDTAPVRLDNSKPYELSQRCSALLQELKLPDK